MRNALLWLGGCLLLLQSGFVRVGVADERPAKPNIIIILADDLGWQDVKCYDVDKPSPMETPNLDGLAKQGVMFWQAYSPAPVCAPSRAAILSGLHPARGEMTSVAGGFPPHAGSHRATLIAPFYSARMPVDRYTIAEALKADGYRTGHCGKWHISNNHYEFPKPYRHGFDVSVHDRGVQVPMKPSRLTGFATHDPKDPYRLDEHGFPFDAPQQGAIDFICDSKDDAFFLYYATWLVHSPIVMRSEALLRKYEQKLGVTLTEEHKERWNKPGQTNPFYCAMVEQFDYYVGQIVSLLKTTDDPRWPGHKLSENTYLFFTSDNGGMEGGRGAVYTDNEPLDRGKISLKEGGTRVPFIVVGPGIPAGVRSDVMVNGIDLYPTILSLVGAKRPAGKHFDGSDLSALLTNDPTDPGLVRDAAGDVRDSMVWHFPQSDCSSSIRVGEFKLFRQHASAEPERYLYRLYTGEKGEVRDDIEEQKDLSAEMTEKAAELDARLTNEIRRLGGRLHYFNPTQKGLPKCEMVPAIVGHKQDGRRVIVTYRNKGAQVTYADLIYSQNQGREWQRMSGRLVGDDQAIFVLPEGTSHYFVNLVDENNFLVIHPPIDRPAMIKKGLGFQDVATVADYPAPQLVPPMSLEQLAQARQSTDPLVTVLAEHDFEGTDLSGLLCTGAGSSLTRDASAAGKQSLQLFEQPGLDRPWMPLVSFPVSLDRRRTAGEFRLSFDCFLDRDIPGEINVTLRGVGRAGEPETAGVLLIREGDLLVNDYPIAPLQSGAWYHVEASCSLSRHAERMLGVSVRTDSGESWSLRVPYAGYLFEQPTEVQIVSVGPENSRALVDNFVATFSH